MESRRRSGNARASWLGVLAVVTAGLFAGWAWTRSDSLARAERIYARAQEPEALAQALRLALDHLDRQPWDRTAALIAARCSSRLDYPDLAETYWRRTGPLGLEDSLVHAHAIHRSNDREGAIAAFRSITERWPCDPRAWRMLGAIYLSRNQFEEAIEVAARLCTIPGGELDGHRMAGMAQHELQTPEAAVAEYEAVLRLDPELKSLPLDARSAFWQTLARDLLATGQADRTVDLLRTELAHRGDPLLRTLLGKAYYQQGEFAQAQECWERAVEADPRLAVAWLELGRLALAENRVEEARVALEKARVFAPRDPEILFSLRSVYQRLGLRDEAAALQVQTEQARQSTPPASGMGARSMSNQPQPAANAGQDDPGTPLP